MNFYNKNVKESSLSLSSKKKLSCFSILIDNDIVYVDFDEKEEFIRIRSESKDRYLLGCLFFLIKFFIEKNYLI